MAKKQKKPVKAKGKAKNVARRPAPKKVARKTAKKAVAKKAAGNGLPRPSSKPQGQAGRRSTAFAFSTLPMFNQARPAPSCSPTWAPT